MLEFSLNIPDKWQLILSLKGSDEKESWLSKTNHYISKKALTVGKLFSSLPFTTCSTSLFQLHLPFSHLALSYPAVLNSYMQTKECVLNSLFSGLSNDLRFWLKGLRPKSSPSSSSSNFYSSFCLCSDLIHTKKFLRIVQMCSSFILHLPYHCMYHTVIIFVAYLLLGMPPETVTDMYQALRLLWGEEDILQLR